MLARHLRLLRRLPRERRPSRAFADARDGERAFADARDGEFGRSPFPDVSLPRLTLSEYVWENMDKWADRTAVVCGVTGHGYTYAQLLRVSAALAANLRARLGLHDGACAALMLPNSPDFPVAALAVALAGGVVSGINPLYTTYEVQRQITLADAKVIFTTTASVPTVKEALIMAKLDIPIIVLKSPEDATPPGTILFSELSEDSHVDISCLKKVKRSHEDVVFLPYSSGTTGLPKGVELTHRNIIANCEQMNEPKVKQTSETSGSYQDVVMAVLPFYHSYASTVVMCHKLSLGAKLVTLPSFKPEQFLGVMKKHRTNLIYAAPPMVLAMTSHPASSKEYLEPIEIITSGAAPLPLVDVERLFDKAQRKIEFIQAYGLTETGPVATMMTRGSTNYASVGYALPNTDIMLLRDGKPAAVGEFYYFWRRRTDKKLRQQGELLIRGPQVMRGYHNNEEATAAALADGWFHSGDLGWRDENGAFYIADRLKELIKVKGYQVPPAELEGVLREHPDVLDVAVVGVPCSRRGEAPRAFVVPRERGRADAEDIKEFVKKRVAPYKMIDDLTFIDSIPKNPSGKILRRVIKEKYC